jgi:hypothetical protein
MKERMLKRSLTMGLRRTSGIQTPDPDRQSGTLAVVCCGAAQAQAVVAIA